MFWSAKPRPWWRFFAENAAITKYGADEDENICISTKDPPGEEAYRKCMLTVQLGCSNIDNLRIFVRKSRVQQCVYLLFTRFDAIRSHFFYKLYWGYQGTAVKFKADLKDFEKDGK